jgi:5'-nucleotidase
MDVKGTVLAVALSVCVIAPGCLYEVEDIDLSGQDVRMTFLHTSDIHSRIFPYDHDPLYTEEQLGLVPGRGPYGGIARVAGIVERERAKAGRSLWVDSGDLFQGAPVFNEFGGEAEVKALSVGGIDAMALGNHEFDAGPRNVARQFGNFADFPVLAANYKFMRDEQPFNDEFEQIVSPYVVFNVDGLVIGIIGMGNLSSMNGLEDGGNSLGVLPLETLQTVQTHVNQLRDDVDLIVILDHLGLGEDETIARNLCGIDLILGGHHHIALDPPKLIPYDPDPEILFGGEIESEDPLPGQPVAPEKDFNDILGYCPAEWERDTLLSHPNAFSKFVGRLDIVVRDKRIVSHRYELFPVDNTAPEHPDVLFALEDYEEEMRRRYNFDVVVTNAKTRMTRFGSTGGDSALGNFLAESMQFREFVETDFCVTNSLGIRTDIDEGPVSIEKIFNVMPFDNTIATMFLSGLEVQELLDFSTARSAERGCTSQIQVSGVRFTMNCRTGKAEDIVLNGEPLSDNGVYELCTNNYIGRGGSGFKVLGRNTTFIDTGISLRDAVIDQLQALPELPVCADPNTPLEQCHEGTAVEDGRITTKY